MQDSKRHHTDEGGRADWQGEAARAVNGDGDSDGTPFFLCPHPFGTAISGVAI